MIEYREDSLAGADVMCPAIPTTSMSPATTTKESITIKTTTITTTSPLTTSSQISTETSTENLESTTSTSASTTTGIGGLREEAENQIDELTNIMNDVDANSTLAAHLEELLAILNGLSGSLGALESNNFRRNLDCSLLERVINLYTDVIALMRKIKELLANIGTSTGNAQLDTLISSMDTYYTNIILKWEGEQNIYQTMFDGQGCQVATTTIAVTTTTTTTTTKSTTTTATAATTTTTTTTATKATTTKTT